MVDVALFLQYAEVAQETDAYVNANRQALNGGTSVNRYARLLYLVRRAVQWKYDQNPTDSSLDATANYMYALSGGRNVTPNSPTTLFIIIIQPSNVTVNSGGNASFLVAVAGGTQPYNYQWYFNNVALSGETNPTLNLTNVDSGDAGNYKVIITDANGQVLTSVNALLTVNVAQLVASWWWGDTDPWPDISTGTDNLTYLGSVNFNAGGPIVIPWPSLSANNKYRVVRYPVAEGDIVSWLNIVGFNYGPVPGTAYNPIATITTKKYVVSKGDSVQSPYSVTYSE